MRPMFFTDVPPNLRTLRPGGELQVRAAPSRWFVMVSPDLPGLVLSPGLAAGPAARRLAGSHRLPGSRSSRFPEDLPDPHRDRGPAGAGAVAAPTLSGIRARPLCCAR